MMLIPSKIGHLAPLHAQLHRYDSVAFRATTPHKSFVQASIARSRKATTACRMELLRAYALLPASHM